MEYFLTNSLVLPHGLCDLIYTLLGNSRRFIGFDHGVGHPLLLLYDAKAPRGQNVKEFNDLGDNPFKASVSLF